MKKRFFLLVLLCLCSLVFATSKEYGKFIYYKDYTFPTETYIGFVEYSDSILAIRYYSPKATVGSKDIALYISLNPAVDYVDMTGEKIIGNVTNDDVTTLNYLHDLIYEFSARRKNVNFSSDSNKVSAQQDYVQFGGDVTIEFDKTLPVYNINKITAKNGNTLFEAITVGTIDANSRVDKFATITNFPNYQKPVIIQNSFQNQNLVWTPATTSGLYFLGDYAMLLCYMIQLDQTDLQDLTYGEWFAKTILYPTSSAASIYLPEYEVCTKSNSCLVSALLVDEDEETINTFDVIQTTDENNIYLIYHYSVMNEYYLENQEYFSDLLKEYR